MVFKGNEFKGHAEDKRELPIWEVNDRLVKPLCGRQATSVLWGDEETCSTCIAQSSHEVTVMLLISSHASSVVAHKIRHIKTREKDWSLAIRPRIDK